MHLIPVTKAGQTALTDYRMFWATPPQNPRKEEWSFGFVFVATLLLLAMAEAFLPATTYNIAEWAIALSASFVLSRPSAIDPRERRKNKVAKAYYLCREVGEIVNVDEELVYRWESLRYRFVLLDEPRAELPQFPDVVRRIVTLHKARKAHPDRNMRKALDAHIEQAMREALKPIEAELDALYEFDEKVAKLEAAAARELRETIKFLKVAYRDAETELLLCMP